METSTYFGSHLCVTGSESSPSHKGTYNLDMGINGKGERKRFAPFTCVVKAVNSTYNTLTCESKGKVISPRFPQGEILCFSVGHLDALRYKVKDTIKQGALLGIDDNKGTTQVHTHWSFGIGKLKMPNFLSKVGEYAYVNNRSQSTKAGIYALACGGWIHGYDFMFLSDDTRMTTDENNPAHAYPWQRVHKEVTVQGKLLEQTGDIYTVKGRII